MKDLKHPKSSKLEFIKLRQNIQPAQHSNDQKNKYSEYNKGLGYGKKTDLDIGKHPHNIVPAPTSYQIDTFVEINKSHEKGVTAHIGR